MRPTAILYLGTYLVSSTLLKDKIGLI